MANVTFTVDAQTAKAVSGFMNLVGAQDKAKKKQGEFTKEAKKTSSALDGLEKKALKLVGAYQLISGAWRSAIDMVNSYDQNMDRLANKSQESTRKIMSFAFQQPAGMVEPRIQEAAAVGAQHGVKFDESLQVMNILQGQYGADPQAYEKALAAAPSVFTGIQAGLDMDTAAKLTASMIQRGYDPGLGVSLPFLAGLKSSRDPFTLGKASRAVGGLAGDPFFTFSAAVPLLGANLGDENLPTLLEAAGRGLMTPANAQAQALFRGQPEATSGADLIDRMELLREKGLTTKSRLAGAGFDERSSRALEVMVNAIPEIQRLMLELQQTQPGAVGSMVKTLKGTPRIGAMFDLEKATAGAELADVSEKRAARSMILEAEEANMLAAARDGGFDFLFGPEGKIKPGKRLAMREFFPEIRQGTLESLYSAGHMTGGERREHAQSVHDELIAGGMSAGEITDKTGVQVTQPGGVAGGPGQIVKPRMTGATKTGVERMIELLEGIEGKLTDPAATNGGGQIE